MNTSSPRIPNSEGRAAVSECLGFGVPIERERRSLAGRGRLWIAVGILWAITARANADDWLPAAPLGESPSQAFLYPGEWMDETTPPMKYRSSRDARSVDYSGLERGAEEEVGAWEEQGVGLGSGRCAEGGWCELDNGGGDEDAVWCWRVLPQGIVYRPYLAAAKESRLSTVVINEREDGLLWDSTLGGRFGLLRFGPADRPEGFQWDIDGAGMVRLDPNEEMDVRGADFRAGTSLNWGYGKHRWRVGFYHLSSHTGDEFLLKNPGYARVNFYRDAFYAGYSYYFTPDFRLYGELAAAFHVEYAEPIELLFGFDWSPSRPTGLRGAPFAALNVHLRQELQFSGNLALQAGWAWRGGDAASGLFRTGLYYYNGGSPQWSFYRDTEQAAGYGIWYDF